jgi:hypothetical protein
MIDQTIVVEMRSPVDQGPPLRNTVDEAFTLKLLRSYSRALSAIAFGIQSQ